MNKFLKCSIVFAYVSYKRNDIYFGPNDPKRPNDILKCSNNILVETFCFMNLKSVDIITKYKLFVLLKFFNKASKPVLYFTSF